MSKNVDQDLIYASKLIAKISTSLLAGSSLYMSLVEHPAKMEAGIKVATTLFEPCYRKSSLLSIVLASTGFLGALSSYAIEADKKWLAAGLLTFSVIPFKYLVMSSTTKSLMAPSIEQNPDKAELLFEKWNRLNMLKSIICLSSMLIMEIYS